MMIEDVYLVFTYWRDTFNFNSFPVLFAGLVPKAKGGS